MVTRSTTDLLTYLDSLVGVWREHVSTHPAADGEFSREAGFLAGITICADQLAERLAAIREADDDE